VGTISSKKKRRGAFQRIRRTAVLGFTERKKGAQSKKGPLFVMALKRETKGRVGKVAGGYRKKNFIGVLVGVSTARGGRPRKEKSLGGLAGNRKEQTN